MDELIVELLIDEFKLVSFDSIGFILMEEGEWLLGGWLVFDADEDAVLLDSSWLFAAISPFSVGLPFGLLFAC